jgi:arylsulfatase A-like enzyme
MQPNILLITSDQQHYSTLGSVNPKIKTPHLDALAAGGTRFDRAYCPNPTCTPTRASIITGQYPSQHGAWALGTHLLPDVPTLGDALAKAGYFTSLIGKAHFQGLASKPGWESIELWPKFRDLDFWRNFHGPWFGFEHVETARMHGDEPWAGGHYAVWMEDNGFADWQEYFDTWPQDRNRRSQYYDVEKRRWTLPAEMHYTTWTGQRTAAQIERAAAEERPFFVWASFHDPHPPYIVPEPWASMYDPADMEPGRLVEGEHELNPPHFGMTQQQRPDFKQFGEEGVIHGGHSHLRDVEEIKKDMACYYGMQSFIDQEVGRILDTLERTGQAENTLVVYSTDHGHFLGQHGLVAKAIHHYEDLLRVPFIVRWPGQVPAGGVSDQLQNLVDLAPTFLAAAGLEVPGAMTGLDQLPSWRGDGPVRSWSVTENHHGYRHFHMRSYVNQRYKITVYRDEAYGELFDLQEDPAETRNLWDEPAAAGLKSQLLLEFMQATLQSEPQRMPRIAGA